MAAKLKHPLRVEGFMRRFALLLTLLLLAIATQARAEARSVPNSSARLRIVSRAGSAFVVDVTNPSDAPTRFDSVGLYFLPDSGEPAQRLGVVSAPRIVTASGEWLPGQEVMTVAPHQTVRLALSAYCLDEHRNGPSEKTTYHLAGRRIPTALSDALAGAVQSAPNPQRAVWAVRAEMPTILLGELRSNGKPVETRLLGHHSRRVELRSAPEGPGGT